MSSRVVFFVVLFLWPLSFSAAVNISIGEENEISIPEEYASENLAVSWFLEDGTLVPDALLRENSQTSVSVLSNVGYLYGIFTDQGTGRSIRSNAVSADRLRSTVARIRLDGTGTAKSISLINNGVTFTPDFSVEIAGIVADAPNGIATVVLPRLSELVGEYDLKVNYPERIGAMYLEDIGISEVEVDASCRNLAELSLGGNSLGFNGLTGILPDDCSVDYGEQALLHIPILSDGITVDLSAQSVSDLEVMWFSEDGEPIKEECYQKRGLLYSFTDFKGKMWCELSSQSKGLTLKSRMIYVGSDMSALFAVSVAGAAGNAVFSVTVTERTSIAVDNGEVQALEPGEETWLRVPVVSGTVTVSVSSGKSVCGLDLCNIGAYTLEIYDAAAGLRNLAVGGNNFTPATVPTGIPHGCVVDWGSQGMMDISGLADKHGRWIDFTGFTDIETTWIDGSTGERLVLSSVLERPSGLFTFSEDAGSSVRAVIKSAIYEGLEWNTSVVEFPNYNSSLPFVTDDDSKRFYSISDGYIISNSGSRLRVYTVDGILKREIAPMGRSSLSSGLYVVIGDGVSEVVRLQ